MRIALVAVVRLPRARPAEVRAVSPAAASMTVRSPPAFRSSGWRTPEPRAIDHHQGGIRDARSTSAGDGSKPCGSASAGSAGPRQPRSPATLRSVMSARKLSATSTLLGWTPGWAGDPLACRTAGGQQHGHEEQRQWHGPVSRSFLLTTRTKPEHLGQWLRTLYPVCFDGRDDRFDVAPGKLHRTAALLADDVMAVRMALHPRSRPASAGLGVLSAKVATLHQVQPASPSPARMSSVRYTARPAPTQVIMPPGRG